MGQHKSSSPGEDMGSFFTTSLRIASDDEHRLCRVVLWAEDVCAQRAWFEAAAPSA